MFSCKIYVAHHKTRQGYDSYEYHVLSMKYEQCRSKNVKPTDIIILNATNCTVLNFSVLHVLLTALSFYLVLSIR